MKGKDDPTTPVRPASLVQQLRDGVGPRRGGEWRTNMIASDDRIRARGFVQGVVAAGGVVTVEVVGNECRFIAWRIR